MKNIYSEMGIRSILLVGEDPWLREALLMFFQLKGCRFQLASNASEAIETLSRNRCDLILCEDWLPDMDGLSFLTKCAKDQPQAVRFLIAAYPDHAEPEDIARHGIDAVLRKPFVVEQLEESLRRLLDNRRLTICP